MQAQISTSDTDRRIIERYTDQPEALPASIRRAVESRMDGDPVQLYALADLDAIVTEKRQLSLQSRVHTWLHYWLLIHGPISWAMI